MERELPHMACFVLREKGTERAFTGEFWDHHEKGVYRCAGCGQALFDSDHKFESGPDGPAFSNPLKAPSWKKRTTAGACAAWRSCALLAAATSATCSRMDPGRRAALLHQLCRLGLRRRQHLRARREVRLSQSINPKKKGATWRLFCSGSDQRMLSSMFRWSIRRGTRLSGYMAR